MSKVTNVIVKGALDYKDIVLYLEEKDSAEFKDIIQEFESRGYTRGQINGRLRDGISKGLFSKTSRGIYSRIKPVESPKNFIKQEFNKTIDAIIQTEMSFSNQEEAIEIRDLISKVKDIIDF